MQRLYRWSAFGSVMFLISVGAAIIWAQSSAKDSGAPLWIRHTGFESLRRGVPGDGGANLYVSRKGRLQTINRWDLNRDGELDLLFTQDHNNVYTPESIVYWGGPEGFQSLLPDMWRWRAGTSLLGYLSAHRRNMTMLPTQGGGRSRIADLNGDGYPDIVLCNYMHNYRPDQNAYIYWGGPNGFDISARTELPAYLAGGVAVADLNHDGRLDIVLANHGDEYGERRGFRLHLESYIYWGNAAGYGPSHRTSVPSISASDVAAGDFNGDGHPDLAFVNNNSQEQSAFIYWGDGKGAFTGNRRRVLSSRDLHLPDSVNGRFGGSMKTTFAADLNGDRLTDLVICGSDRAVVFSGGVSGLSAAPSELPAKNCGGIEAADLNRDGHLDLILANEGSGDQAAPASSIFWGSAQGYAANRKTDLPALAATTVSVADLNRDGFPDILFGNAHDADSYDVPSYIYWGGPNGYSPYRRSGLLGFGVAGSGIADLNRDGHPDVLLVGHLSGSTHVLPSTIYWGNPEHSYSSASTTLLDPGGEMEYSAADLDDDGYPDLVLLHGKQAAIWWGSAGGHRPENRTFLPMRQPISSSIADLNRDGFLDIVMTSHAGPAETHAPVMILWGNANRFKDARTTEFELGAASTEANTIADLNRDGYLDLIFPQGMSDQSEIWYGSAEGYRPQNHKLIDADGAPHAAVADLDADGWLDVVFTAATTATRPTTNLKAWIYWGSPNGFSTAARTPLENYTGLDAAAADFNRDGHLDLVLTNYRSDTARDMPAFVYWGDGTRNFSEKRRTILEATSCSAVDALDLNRDGWVDLVISNHQKSFDHSAGTYIYWGGAEGFSRQRRAHLPTVGVHLDSMVEAGSIYHRKHEWDYVSAPAEAPAGAAFARLHWKAETGLGTAVRFQVRTAGDRGSLERSTWDGPDGPASFYTQSGASLRSPAGRWMQYRAVLTSPDGGNSPALTEVAVECLRR
ncbi:MAG: FG-GAP repeat domain-containing protein [Bryobacteraceae bacterium]